MKAICMNNTNTLYRYNNIYIVVRGNVNTTKNNLELLVASGIALIFRTLPKALNALKAP